MISDELDGVLRAAGIEPDETAAEKLRTYAGLVIERNKTMNLIGPATEGDIASRHIADSLAPLMAGALRLEDRSRRVTELPPSEKRSGPTRTLQRGTPRDFAGKSLIDVGSGAGFPGMVLAIVCPSLRVFLCDSLGKRCDFLAECARALSLDNVEVLNARAEELGHTALRESFDFAAARAVTAMPALCELCLPLVKVGGKFLAYKTARAGEEIASSARAARLLGGRADDPFDYRVGDAAMRLAVVRKVSPTPARYPRSWGRIKAKPL